ncbi:PadR family transcriptional regulator [Carboxydochorda subterranea]|uniref:PadR family transcriptional regulator n=1 Tax=Carboxydichorda subterranea TaxID=3109565 RepID=A0ABZ1C1L3_9FIRM|nr:PadR family transcriptional regulator [Limnochorda sp. L945t]WRP18755.1 PadR family transcriptional regulator [Limnochorda sp. L945t]
MLSSLEATETAAKGERDTRGEATRLIILGYLRERPAHGYEIQRWIRIQQMDRWSSVLPGSLYHALKRMEGEGLIKAVAEERTGDRLRKVYAITPAGERAFERIVRRLLAAEPHSTRSDFALAAGWLDVLPSAEAVAILERTVRRLEETRQLWETGRAIKAQYAMPPAVEAAFDNARRVLDADIAFVRSLIRMVQEGRTGLEETRERLQQLKDVWTAKGNGLGPVGPEREGE